MQPFESTPHLKVKQTKKLTMKTKLIFTAALVMLLFNLSSCKGKSDISYNEQVGKEIIESIQEALAEINDSTFNDINIVADEDGDGVVVVNRSGLNADENGNINMKIDVNVEDDTSSPFTDAFVAIFLIILFSFFSPVTIVFIVFYFLYRNKRDRNRVIETSLTTGHELPKEFYAPFNPHRRLQSGVAYMAWGIGLFIFFMCIDSDIAWLCIIPCIIGIGKLIAYFLYEHKGQKAKCNELSNVE